MFDARRQSNMGEAFRTERGPAGDFAQHGGRDGVLNALRPAKDTATRREQSHSTSAKSAERSLRVREVSEPSALRIQEGPVHCNEAAPVPNGGKHRWPEDRLNSTATGRARVVAKLRTARQQISAPQVALSKRAHDRKGSAPQVDRSSSIFSPRIGRGGLLLLLIRCPSAEKTGRFQSDDDLACFTTSEAVE
jgi:hypothetical protein